MTKTEVLDDLWVSKNKKKWILWVPNFTLLLWIVFAIGLTFKLLHWPMADILMLSGMGGAALIQLFLYPKLLRLLSNKKLTWFSCVFTGVVLALASVSVVWHFFTWRYGEYITTVCLVALPVWFGINMFFRRKKVRLPFKLNLVGVLTIGFSIFGMTEGPINRFERNQTFYSIGVSPSQDYLSAFENYYYNPTDSSRNAYLKQREEYRREFEKVANSK